MENQDNRCRFCFHIKETSGVCPHCGCDDSMRNAPHQLPLGTVLHEQYQIGRVLGQGGFGITYHGWDLYLDIPVAIKEYYPSGMVMRESATTMSVFDISGDNGERFRNNRDRFMREAKLLARFSDVREVVQVKNFFLTNNTAYIVMEYVEGITLTEYVKNRGGKLSPQETFAIFGPIIQTMAKVHKTGIIHRDIKPNNIMMVAGGAKMLDFGAGRDMTGATTGNDPGRTTEAIVTHGFAAFEQYQRRGLGSWTDVYALCATMYYCMTGEVPPDSPGRVLDDEKLDFAAIEGLTPAQIGALIHGTEIRSDRRTPTMEQLYQELFPVEEPILMSSIQKPHFPKSSTAESVTEGGEKTQINSAAEEKISAEGKTRKEKKTDSVSTSDKPESSAPRWTGGKILLLLVSAFALVALFSAVIFGLKGNESDWIGASLPRNLIDNTVSGDCGVSARWELDLDTGVMTLTGSVMYNFYLDEYDEYLRQNAHPRPWEAYTEQITEVVFAGDFYRIGQAAFAHCPNLTKVTFNDKVKEIGPDAFWDSGLTELTLPESLVLIEWGAFEHTQLREVTIPVYVDVVQHNAFAFCPNLERVNLSFSTRLNYDLWNNASTFCREDGTTADVIICGPEGGLAEDYANLMGHRFESNGQQVLYEDEGDFSAFPGNADGRWYFDRDTMFLKIEGEMPTDMAGQWEFYHDEQKEHWQSVPLTPWVKHGEYIATVSVAEGVTRICDNAFANLPNLTDVYLPSTLKEIGFQAFLVTNIDEIYIPDSVTRIHRFAFNWCQNLRVARLPMGLELLERGTFSMNTNLEKVYISNVTVFECEERNGQRMTPFNNQTMQNADGVDENVMPQNLTLISPQGESGNVKSNARIFAEEYGLGYEEGVFGMENAEQTGDLAFGLSNVSWAYRDGVLLLTGAGETPIYRASSQSSNRKGVPSFTGEAPWYSYRNDIHTVIVEPGVTVLNQGILCDMPNLQNVHLHNVGKLGTGAIDNCGMEHLELGVSVFHIAKGAISDCVNLRELHIHNGYEKVENGAIQDCFRLEKIYFWNEAPALDVNGNLFDGDMAQNLTIYGKQDSPAQKYANNHGIPYEIIW